MPSLFVIALYCRSHCGRADAFAAAGGAFDVPRPTLRRFATRFPSCETSSSRCASSTTRGWRRSRGDSPRSEGGGRSVARSDASDSSCGGPAAGRSRLRLQPLQRRRRKRPLRRRKYRSRRRRQRRGARRESARLRQRQRDVEDLQPRHRRHRQLPRRRSARTTSSRRRRWGSTRPKRRSRQSSTHTRKPTSSLPSGRKALRSRKAI